MRKFYLIAIIFFCGIIQLTAQDSLQNIIIGQVEAGSETNELSESKIDAGVMLAIDMTNKYKSVSNKEKRKIIKEEGSDLTIEEMAEEADAEWIAFARVDVFNNMLRADLTLVKTGEGTKKHVYGFAAVHYKKDENTPVYDPAILKAFQRAFMTALEDSSLYEHQPDMYHVKPAPPLVIGGFVFNQGKEKFKWEYFKNKSVSSYFASETLFEVARKNKNFAVYDIATRDSMYAQYKLHLVENFYYPTNSELKILENFDVQYYLYGSIKREGIGADVKVMLAEINDQNLNVKSTAEGRLNKDDLEEFEELIKNLTEEVLKSF